MDDFLATFRIGNSHSIHIASLARQTIIDAGAEHMGFDGYFLFESDDSCQSGTISILGKATSLDAAFRMMEIWQHRISVADELSSAKK